MIINTKLPRPTQAETRIPALKLLDESKSNHGIALRLSSPTQALELTPKYKIPLHDVPQASENIPSRNKGAHPTETEQYDTINFAT